MDPDMQARPGCLGGLVRLFALNWVYQWLQRTVGTGRGGCSGIGCGAILFIVFIFFACSIFGGTDWFRLGF
jgi:hypothetical protein